MSALITNAPVGDWQYASTSDIADTNAVEAAAAPGSGRCHRVTDVTINNSDTAIGTVVNVRSGTTVLWSGFVSPYVAAAPGVSHISHSFVRPLKGGNNEAINVICITSSAQVRVSLGGYTERIGSLV
jgi:hypothetical protein